MPLQLGDLLSLPRLGLRLLSGAEQRHRLLSRVYTTDLLCPTRYLGGGELVLTGMLWYSSPADCETFVASLAEAGAAALGAGIAARPVPPDLIEACVRHRLPLLEVPAATSFGVITEEVLRLLGRVTTFAEDLDRNRRLMADLASGSDFAEVFTTAAVQRAVTSWVVSSTGHPVVTAGPPLPATQRVDIARKALTCSSFPCHVRLPAAEGHAERSLRVLPVQTQQSHPLARWLLVYAEDPVSGAEFPSEAVDELMSLAVLARSRSETHASDRAQHAASLPALLAEPRYEETAALLRSGGVLAPRTTDHVVVRAELVAQPPFSDAQPPCSDLMRRILVELLAEQPQKVITGDNDVLAVISAAEDVAGHTTTGTTAAGDRPAERIRAELAEGLRALEHGLDRYRLCLGMSATTRRLEDLRGAVQEATHARRLARSRAGRSQVVTGDEIDTHELLLASVPLDVREIYRERMLGPLLEYDRVHRSSLIETLERFLAYSGSWRRCAEALHIHVSTLRYRIGRVEELTGRDLTRLDHRTDLLLALRLRE